MKPFKVKKQTGGNHYKIFIRRKLAQPKPPLTLLTKTNPPTYRIHPSDMEFTIN